MRGVEVIVIFSGATPTLALIIGNTKVEPVIAVDHGDGVSIKLPSQPAGRPA